MLDQYNSIGAALDALFGGAMATLFGAAVGRLMYHATQVKKGVRRFFSRELLWEAPIAFGMALVGEAVVYFFSLQQPVSTGVIAGLAYLGPRGAEVLMMNWIGRKAK